MMFIIQLWCLREDIRIIYDSSIRITFDYLKKKIFKVCQLYSNILSQISIYGNTVSSNYVITVTLYAEWVVATISCYLSVSYKLFKKE